METTVITCSGCGRQRTTYVVGGEPLNTTCRTRAATGRCPAGDPDAEIPTL